VSKHWKPDRKVMPLRRVGRRRWTRIESYVRDLERSWPSGATVGVVLVAAACAGAMIGLYQASDYSGSFAADAATMGTPRFSYCKWGGGTNCVVDGDTFYIRGAKVRIADIDAPETHPPRCAYEAQLGNEATEKLHALLNSGAVTMTSIDRDRDVYGRLLRNVAVNGADVGEAMVSAGVAREWVGRREPWC
jgi:endonuclease YncB( thermonuclease family)